MTRLTNLGMGTVSALVLSFGLILWTPGVANAAPGGPEDGYGGESGCSAIHKIAVGDNLTSIAAEHGISLEALIEANNIEDANIIVLDQALCIPESDGSSHGGPSQNGSSHERSSYDDESYGGPSYREESSEDYGNSYGTPGQSYDPSRSNQQSGNGREEDSHGSQSNGYGPKDERYDDGYLAPGTSRPSYPGEYDDEDDENGYGDDGYGDNGYGRDDYGDYEDEEYGYGNRPNGESSQSYGPKQESDDSYNGYGHDEGYKGTPGKAYDPSVSYQPQSEPRYPSNGYDPDYDDDDDEPGTNDNPSGGPPEEPGPVTTP